MAAMPEIRYEVDLDSPPGSTVRIWTDISAYALPGWTIRRGSASFDTRPDPASFTFAVRNDAGRFDPTNGSGPYAGKLLPLRPVRVSVRKPDLSYAIRFTGLVLDWPQAWRKHGRYGYAEIPCTDATLAFGGFEFGMRFEDMLRGDGPAYWYPLDGPAGAQTNLGDGAAPTSADQTASTISWPASLITGNPGLSTQVIASNAVGNGTALTLDVAGAIGDVTAEVLFEWVSGPPAGASVTTSIVVVDNPRTGVQVHADAAGSTRYRFVYQAGGVDTFVDLGAVAADGPHHWALVASAAALRVYKDGVQVTALLAGFDVKTVTVLYFGEGTSLSGAAATATWRTDEAVVFLGVQTAGAILRRAAAALASGGTAYREFPQQTSSTRIAAILDTVGWASTARVLDAGGLTLLATGSVQGKTGEQLLSDTAAAELGQVFLTADGRVAFHTRAHRDALTVPSFTFGEDTASGELPYTSDLLINYDWRDIVNSAELTINDPSQPSGTIYSTSAEDATSISRYFRRTYNGLKAFPYASPADLDTTAARIVARGKDPHARLDRITVDPLAYPALWPFVHDAEIGMLIRVRRRSPGAPLIQLDCFIEQVNEQQGLNLYRLELTLSPKL